MTLHVSTVMLYIFCWIAKNWTLEKSGSSHPEVTSSYETTMFLPSNIRGPQCNQTAHAVVMMTGAFDHCHFSNFTPFHWPSSKLFSLHVSWKTQRCDSELEKWFWLNRRHSWRYLISELNANTYLHHPLLCESQKHSCPFFSAQYPFLEKYLQVYSYDVSLFY